MIQITCTNCKTVLSIDDAFAGGVCRCRHCGTIQTVPKHLRDSAPDGSGVVAQAGGKALYRNRKSAAVADSGASGTGLDDLANVVASSGLSSGRLRKPNGSQDAAPAGNKMMLIISIAGAIILVLLGIIILMAVHEKTVTPVANNTGPASSPAPTTSDNRLVWNSGNNVKVPRPPQFLTHRILDDKVVYIIDRGQSAAADGKLDLLKEAVASSLETLGDKRKFQVIFWSLDNKVWAYPDNGLANADAKHVKEFRSKMDDVYGAGQPKLAPALEKAIKSNADAILLVPVKASLDEGFYPMVMKTRGSSKVKIYAFSIDNTEIGEILGRIAKETGGKYYDLKMSDLRAALQ